MENKKKYYLLFVILCLVCFVSSCALSHIETVFLKTTDFWMPTLFFGFSTLSINSFITKGDNSSKEFVFKTLAISMARLLLCMIFVFIYSLINKPQALAFTCHFMIQYLFFTVFEIYFLLQFIKQKN